MRLAVVNLKGGTGKTTTAMYLAHALSNGASTLLVDADPQGSALSWSETAETLPFPVVALPVNNLHRQLDSVAAPYQHAVIDTPPGHPAIVGSALRWVDTALVTVQPTVLDLDRLQATLELLNDVLSLNDQMQVRVLLTRVRRGTRSLREIRDLLAEEGVDVLTTEIHQRETLALAGGSVVTDLGDYADLMRELQELAVV